MNIVKGEQKLDLLSSSIDLIYKSGCYFYLLFPLVLIFFIVKIQKYQYPIPQILVIIRRRLVFFPLVFAENVSYLKCKMMKTTFHLHFLFLIFLYKS